MGVYIVIMEQSNPMIRNSSAPPPRRGCGFLPRLSSSIVSREKDKYIGLFRAAGGSSIYLTYIMDMYLSKTCTVVARLAYNSSRITTS